MLAQKYTFLVDSREGEMEAERIGFKYAVAAGYDKNEVEKFCEKLLQIEKSGKGEGGVVKSLSDALSTHTRPTRKECNRWKNWPRKAPDRKAVINTPDFNRAKALAALLGKKQQPRTS